MTDVAPTVMALLGLPVPRHATGVFIDDVVGSIARNAPLNGASGYPMVGGNCTVAVSTAETGAGARMDRTCVESYTANEHPAVRDSSTAWSQNEFTRWNQVVHYRDLYQQK